MRVFFPFGRRDWEWQFDWLVQLGLLMLNSNCRRGRSRESWWCEKWMCEVGFSLIEFAFHFRARYNFVWPKVVWSSSWAGVWVINFVLFEWHCVMVCGLRLRSLSCGRLIGWKLVQMVSIEYIRWHWACCLEILAVKLETRAVNGIDISYYEKNLKMSTIQ